MTARLQVLQLQIVPEGLAFYDERGDLRVLKLHDSLTLENKAGAKISIRLHHDCRRPQVDCPRCHGEGQLCHGPRRDPDAKWESCGDCKGTGEIDAPVIPERRASTGDPLVAFALVDEEPKPDPESLKPVPPEGVPF